MKLAIISFALALGVAASDASCVVTETVTVVETVCVSGHPPTGTVASYTPPQLTSTPAVGESSSEPGVPPASTTAVVVVPPPSGSDAVTPTTPIMVPPPSGSPPPESGNVTVPTHGHPSTGGGNVPTTTPPSGPTPTVSVVPSSGAGQLGTYVGSAVLAGIVGALAAI